MTIIARPYLSLRGSHDSAVTFWSRNVLLDNHKQYGSTVALNFLSRSLTLAEAFTTKAASAKQDDPCAILY